MSQTETDKSKQAIVLLAVRVMGVLFAVGGIAVGQDAFGLATQIGLGDAFSRNIASAALLFISLTDLFLIPLIIKHAVKQNKDGDSL